MALGSYMAASSRDKTLNALANPNVVDPVGAMGKAYAAYNSLAAVRENQAQQAWGDALQQATDPDTGVVDYKHAAALASQNPLAAMGMMKNLATSSNIQSQQNEQVAQHFALVANQGTTLMRDPSDANVKSVVQNFKDAGYPDSMADALQTRLLAMSPAERQKFAYQHAVGSLSSLDRLQSQTGATGLTTFGGTTAPTTVIQPSPYGPGGVTVGGGIAHTQDPGTYYSPQSSPIGLDANNQPTSDPSKIVRQIPRVVPQGPAMGAPAPGTVSGPGGGGGGQSGPPTPPAANAPPLPTGYKPRPTATPTPTAPPASSTAPASPAATAPPAASTAPPAATPPPAAPAAAAPPVATPRAPTGGVITGMPTGAEAGAADDVTQYKKAQADMPAQQQNLVAGKSALDALALARTGPGTDFVNRVKAFAQAQGIDIFGGTDPNSTAAYQIARKNLLRFAQNNGSRIGTDLGLATQLESNPNVDQMVNAANDHVLKQDIGLARQRVAQTQEAVSGSVGQQGGVGMGNHVSQFTANTDPVAFAWDLLSPDEQNKHIAEVSKVKGGLDKLDKSLEIAAKHGLINVPKS